MTEEIEIECRVVSVEFGEGVAGSKLSVIGERALGPTVERRDSLCAINFSGGEAARYRNGIERDDFISAKCRPTTSILDYQGMRIAVFWATEPLALLYRPTNNPKPAQAKFADDPDLPEVYRQKGVAAQLRELGLVDTKPLKF